MKFTNSQLFNDELPKIGDVILKPISKQFIKVIALNKLLLYSIIFLVLFLAKWFIPNDGIQQNFWYLFTILLVFSILNFGSALLAFSKRKYAIRTLDIIYAKGLLVNSITTVPISRIQHVEVSRSWLARRFHLATLNIYTAGESGSDLSIKGLPNEVAREINDFISAKVNGNS
ncbi:hypothetical protein A9Q86_11685 [Flavobacteriales bacterium 33_180_T64]|nr:hypothetical protein A9Q86_11685 [Flavobacteriales bacterium 33_180_T64]